MLLRQLVKYAIQSKKIQFELFPIAWYEQTLFIRRIFLVSFAFHSIYYKLLEEFVIFP